MSEVELPEGAGLRFVDADEAGLGRCVTRGTIGYVDAEGRRVRDPATLARIAALVIPPAWTDVWICRDPTGHLQATGRDAKGRKQYRYHDAFRASREAAKYDQLLPFGEALPAIRARVDHDLRGRGTGHDRVVALVVKLLELTAIRVGNDSYARANRSYGLTTLLDRHARFEPGGVAFTFRGKSGKDHAVALHDRRVARMVRACQELPGQRLFQWVDGEGQRHPVTSTDVNTYLGEISPFPVTAKHFRTWAGTWRVAERLARTELPPSARAANKAFVGVIDEVAAELGNTRAVCRSSYVHPMVPAAFLDGSLPALWAAGPSRGTRWMARSERRLLRLLAMAEGGQAAVGAAA